MADERLPSDALSESSWQRLPEDEAQEVVRALKEAREALHQSESEYRTLFDLAGAGMTHFDLRTRRFIRVNRRMSQITGYSEEELLRLSYLDFTHPEDIERDRLATEQLASGEIDEYVTEKRYVHKDGSIRWVVVNAVAIHDEQGRPVRTVSIIHDITDRKRAEAHLDASLDRLRLAQLASESGVWDMDFRTQQMTWTPEYYHLYGHPPQLTPSFENWQASIHPDDRERAEREIRQFLEARATRCVVEFRRVHPQRGLRWFHSVSHIIYDESGPVRMIGLTQDVTEARRLERELRRSNEELQHFANVVAHDLRSPLLSINGCVDLLSQASANWSPDNRQLVGYIQQSVDGMSQLIASLLAFTRIGFSRIEAGVCDLEVAIDRAMHGLRSLAAENDARVTYDSLPAVTGDATMLAQLFQNLLENAIKYRGSEPPVIQLEAAREGSFCTVSIRDNGIGIEESQLEHIFRPFHRTRDGRTKPGVGLGLATCRKIVERHGGRIWAESTPGRGTIFFFTLPSANPESETADPLR